MKWAYSGILLLALVSGCFWMSPPPNLRSDPMRELVVIWDMPQGKGTVIQTMWSTTNQTELAAFTKAIPTETWESASILLSSHPTRILFTTAAGKKWEMHLHTADRLSLFNVTDPGWSGTVSRKSQDIVSLLSAAIGTSVGQKVDLCADYSGEVLRGGIQRVVPEATRQVQLEYWVKN